MLFAEEYEKTLGKLRQKWLIEGDYSVATVVELTLYHNRAELRQLAIDLNLYWLLIMPGREEKLFVSQQAALTTARLLEDLATHPSNYKVVDGLWGQGWRFVYDVRGVEVPLIIIGKRLVPRWRWTQRTCGSIRKLSPRQFARYILRERKLRGGVV